MEESISIEFGALVPEISEQLVKQGIAIPIKRAKAFDELAHSLIMLHLHGLIPDSVRDSSRKKLMAQISKEVHKAI
jgi:hypothetical protein